jgi:magnesium-transporting ATPase (P-type)
MEYNSFIGLIPWPVAAATAAWFSAMAYRSGKSIILWAICGGLMGLVVTTITLGLAQATFIPFYTSEVAPFRLKIATLAIVLVACTGWVFTGSLHHRLLAVMKPSTPPPPAPTPPAKPPTSPAKP